MVLFIFLYVKYSRIIDECKYKATHNPHNHGLRVAELNPRQSYIAGNSGIRVFVYRGSVIEGLIIFFINVLFNFSEMCSKIKIPSCLVFLNKFSFRLSD